MDRLWCNIHQKKKTPTGSYSMTIKKVNLFLKAVIIQISVTLTQTDIVYTVI